MRAFFLERLLPRVPESIQSALSFDLLYEAFGGKLAHWQDYIDEYGKTVPSVHDSSPDCDALQ